MTDQASCEWKENWALSRRRYLDWWRQAAFVVSSWTPPAGTHMRDPGAVNPGPPASIGLGFTDYQQRAARQHHAFSQAHLGLDILPIAETDVGPGSLAAALGATPDLSFETIWFYPCWDQVDDPETLPALSLNHNSPWWQLHVNQLRECKRLGAKRYLTGMPDLVENIDILASLRRSDLLMEDFIEYPEWVESKLLEITAAWIEGFDELYEIIKEADGSSAFSAFALWGPGKTAKLQSDASAMISPRMFERFVLPTLQQQCRHVDNNMYHLDGSECLDKLDLLLSLPELNAIEWTPDPKVPPGGDPHWYPMYRRILEAGKSIQVVHLRPPQVLELLDSVGTQGVYAMVEFRNAAEAEALESELARRYGYECLEAGSALSA